MKVPRILTTLPSKKMVIVGSIILCLIVGGSIYVSMKRDAATVSTKELTFETLTPEGKSVDTLGGWKRVSPADDQPVYAYVDTIEGVTVSVSQQDIPDSFGMDTKSKVAELAKNFNATNTINAGDLTVYIGTSAKGPQSVIFTKNKTLILIKSENKISGSAWAAYIESLK